MNYFDAREILGPDGEPSGRWRYTCRNDDKVWAVGYCAEGCPGHPTPEEAREHYRQFVLDGMRVRGPKPADSWPKDKCAVEGCPAEATHLLDAPGHRCHEVCESHANRAAMELLVPSIGWGMSS